MKKHYVSLGQTHFRKLSTGEFWDKDGLVEIIGKYEDVREFCLKNWGERWCMIYDEDNVDFSFFPKGIVKSYRV